MKHFNKNVLVTAMIFSLTVLGFTGPMSAFAFANPAVVNLGEAGNFAVLSKVAISDTVPTATVVTGAIGVSPAPATAITGLDCAEVMGTIHVVSAGGATLACQTIDPAYLTPTIGEMEAAYTDANSRTADVTLGGDLSGLTLTPGVYFTASSLAISTNVTLDCSANADGVFIFQVGGDLSMSANTDVVLNSCNSGNVFWAVAGTTNIGGGVGTESTFVGTILGGPATSEITVITGSTVLGRLLGQKTVALDQNIITLPSVTPPTPPVVEDCIGASSFDGESAGSVNGQEGWSVTGGYDQAVVENTYGFASFGCKSLRLSNAVTSGSFGDQTFSPSNANEAGEADSTANGMSGGIRQNHFEAQFDFASTQSAQQPGLFVSVSPDRGDGSRMSYLGFSDLATGIDVIFYDTPGTTNPANFAPTTVATGLSRNVAHTAKFVIDYANGPSNDVVKIYIDGTLVYTGTTWENYYRFDSESSAEQTPRTTDDLLFRVGGTAVPANSGNGYLFDNVILSALDAPNPVPVITSLSIVNNQLTAGDPGTTLHIFGTGFSASTSVTFGGSTKVITFVSPTDISIEILASDISSNGAKAITVTNLAPGGGTVETSLAVDLVRIGGGSGGSGGTFNGGGSSGGSVGGSVLGAFTSNTASGGVSGSNSAQIGQVLGASTEAERQAQIAVIRLQIQVLIQRVINLLLIQVGILRGY